jgi:uncharacterized protein (DUF362 family)
MARKSKSPLQPLEKPRSGHRGDDAQREKYPDGASRVASRRELLKLGGKLALAGAGFGYLYGWRRDPTGAAALPQPDIVRLPEGGFAVPGKPNLPEMVVVRGDDRAAMVRAGLEALGGIERFLAPGDRVVVKPNVAFDRSPALGATTHPDLVRAVVRLARGQNCADVKVVDNPINSPEGCFHKSGISKAAGEAGAEIVLPNPAHFRTLEVPGVELIARWPMFYRPFVGATRVIGLTPLKDHNLCSASMTMKNWYGLLGGRRNQFHQNIHQIISELASMMRPSLVILDAVATLVSNGPTGGSLSDVKPNHTMVLATDQLAADSYAYEMLLERDPTKLAYLDKAQALGVGNKDWRKVRWTEVKA